MKKLLLLLFISINVVAKPAGNLTLYNGLGLGGNLNSDIKRFITGVYEEVPVDESDETNFSHKSKNSSINLGARYLINVTNTVSVGPFVDYIFKTEYMYDVTNDDETKNYFNLGHYILSYGISAQYRHQSGAYGLASVGLNNVDITGDLFNYFSDKIVDVSKPNGTTFIGTVGYMISLNFLLKHHTKPLFFPESLQNRLLMKDGAITILVYSIVTLSFQRLHWELLIRFNSTSIRGDLWILPDVHHITTNSMGLTQSVLLCFMGY